MKNRKKAPITKKTSAVLLESFRLRTPDLLDWEENLAPTQRKKLRITAVREEHCKLVYLDSFYRLRQTTPLILAAIQRFNADPLEKAATEYWSRHLIDEVNHDKVMLSDLREAFGDTKRLAAALAENPITPPSAALLGYFQWQVSHGNPHFLMLFRFYLEWFAANHQALLGEFSENLKRRGTRTIELHAELDPHHSSDCAKYVDQHLGEASPALLRWHTDFIVDHLIQGQLWIAEGNGCLRSRSS